MTRVALDGRSLTRNQVVSVARNAAVVELSPAAVEHMRATRALVERALERGDQVYGMTTGVGARKKIPVTAGQMTAFNRALVANHLVGAGPDAPPEVVRATMVRLANALASGMPGARPEIAERRKRKAGLGLGRARRENEKATLAGRLPSREPNRRLSDSGLPREHGGSREAVWVEEAGERLELALPADRVDTGDGHGSLTTHPMRSAGRYEPSSTRDLPLVSGWDERIVRPADCARERNSSSVR